MRRILNFLIFLLGLSGAIQALAQTPVPLPVQGNLGSISGSGVPYAGIDIQLQNCPSPVSITGYFGIIQQEYQVQADPSGNINTTVWPNDLITCNGTTGNSQYNLSLVLNGVVQGTPQCYQVVSTQGLWNLNTQQPITCSQPAPNPQDKTFNNLTVNGFFQGHNGDFSGTLDFGSANVPGKVCNVAFYGGIGNGIANDHDAIQLAVDTCYANGGSVYFPTRWTSTGQTVYYTATSISPKGVSMFGPPGAGGPEFGVPAVVIKGAPGQDVFNFVDPTSGSYVAPHETFAVQDLAISVDATSDVSTSNTTRRPGRVCMDVAADGSSTITSATQCEFQPGDVGQAIKVGSTTTTISTWISATSVTLATTVTSGSNLTTYISVMGLPVTQNIGNCAFAADDSTGIGAEMGKAQFRNISINIVGTNYANNTCGFFFQGNATLDSSRMVDVSVGATTYGMAFVPASLVAPSSSIYTGIIDYNVFDHVYIAAAYPLLMYSPELQQIRHAQIFSNSGYMPQFINAYGAVSRANQNTFDFPEIESNCVSGAGTSLRVAGTLNHFDNMGFSVCNGSVTQWDATDSDVDNLSMGAHTVTWNLTGTNNNFYLQSGADLFNQFVTMNDTGGGNTFKTGTLWNPVQAGRQPGRATYALPSVTSLATAPYGSPSVSRGRVALNRTSDFINKGAAHYYFNDEDIEQIWPHELISTGYGLIISDGQADSPSGSSFIVPAPGGLHLDVLHESYMYLGSQVPATKLRLYYMAKAPSATNITAYLQAYYSAAWHNISSCSPAAIATTYATYACDGDATGLDGDQFEIVLVSSAVNASVATLGIRPWDSDTLSTSLTLGSGVAMTANQGNGTSLQHSTGSTTTNDCVKFDANGNTIDAGVSCSASGGFSSGSNANGRWVTDPTGTTTERGCISVTAGGSTHVTGAVTFPLTFPTALDSLTGSPNNAPDGGDSGTAAASLWFTSTGASGATANYRCVVDVGGGGCAAISNTVPICWIAIGR